MKTSLPSLSVVLAIVLCGSPFSLAQSPVLPRLNMPGRPTASAPSAPTSPDTLSTNYQITFSATSEGKTHGELSLLTCSPEVSVSGPLNSGTTPTSFTVTGALTEKEGELLFRYGIAFSFPITTSTISSKPDGPVAANIQYQQHSSQGMLRMKVGTPYEVLKASGVVYTITITQAPTK